LISNPKNKFSHPTFEPKITSLKSYRKPTAQEIPVQTPKSEMGQKICPC